MREYDGLRALKDKADAEKDIRAKTRQAARDVAAKMKGRGLGDLKE